MKTEIEINKELLHHRRNNHMLNCFYLLTEGDELKALKMFAIYQCELQKQEYELNLKTMQTKPRPDPIIVDSVDGIYEMLIRRMDEK